MVKGHDGDMDEGRDIAHNNAHHHQVDKVKLVIFKVRLTKVKVIIKAIKLKWMKIVIETTTTKSSR